MQISMPSVQNMGWGIAGKQRNKGKHDYRQSAANDPEMSEVRRKE